MSYTIQIIKDEGGLSIGDHTDLDSIPNGTFSLSGHAHHPDGGFAGLSTLNASLVVDNELAVAISTTYRTK